MKSDTRLAIVEDASGVRAKLVETLDAHPGWRVVAACANAAQALREIPAAKPDLVLLDIMLPGGSGTDLLRPLRSALPQAHLIMLTVVEHAADIVRAIHAGACGYILKTDDADLVRDIEVVLAGGAPVISPSVARQLWKHAQAGPPPATQESSGLSPREWEILQLAARGKQQGEIAQALGISVNTVKTHLRRIYDKLGTGSVLESLHKIASAGSP